MHIRTTSLPRFALLLTCGLLAAPSALGASLDDALAGLRGQSGPAFATQAAALLDDEGLRQRVLDARSSLAWTSASFEHDALVQILADRAEHPEAFARLKAVKGLDPAVYLQARKPVPLATREVTRMKLPVGTLLEAWLFRQQELLARSKDAYARAGAREVSELRAAEQGALRSALLTALARTAHPAGVRVLVDHLDAHRADDDGRLAAVLLGETRSDEAQRSLVAVLDDRASAGPLRAAALVGLGKLRNQAALDRIALEARRSNGEARLAAVRALGSVASRSALRARGAPDAEQLRARATDELVRLLPGVAHDVRMSTVVAESLSVVGHPSAVAKLEALAASTSDARVKKAADRALRSVGRSLARRR